MAEGRYFFALWPDESVRRRLAALAKQADARGRMHHPEDLHMTLVFLGQVADERLRCVYDVADTIRGTAFGLAIDGTGYWPRPRILWAGPSTTPEALSQLVFDLQNALAGCGFEPERRRYKPHITLLRKALHGEAGTIDPPVVWTANGFVLAVSGGGEPGAPRYRVVRRWPLSPAASE